MNSVTINGVQYQANGSISVINGVVKIDGKRIDAKGKDGILEVHVTGTLSSLTTDASVSCEDVKGDVKAAGSVNCDNVGGDVTAGGSVNCDDVRGSITAGGSVNHG